MKNRKIYRSSSRFVPEDKYSPSTYLRLCHRCLFLNESSRYIEKCVRCESSFAEFSSSKDANYKNFDINEEDPVHEAIADFESEAIKGGEIEAEEQLEQEEEEEDLDREERARKKRATPISGLSVLW